MRFSPKVRKRTESPITPDPLTPLTWEPDKLVLQSLALKGYFVSKAVIQGRTETSINRRVSEYRIKSYYTRIRKFALSRICPAHFGLF